ncbi:hypothetical protein RHMOL_Rhmol13G0033800 [Rhododendron molle]|uniref:Uncharacterized protein n=1 Tax=Rhododendron molle TaxID=49168 RepID=A0ACC0L2H7_RHOML|nr:hypothetical protein RHMOL_Rhmol13G0033800 [Rhododendron molle]
MSFLRTNLEFYLHKSELESRTASTGKSSSLLRTASELPTEKLNKSIVLVLDVKSFGTTYSTGNRVYCITSTFSVTSGKYIISRSEDNAFTCGIHKGRTWFKKLKAILMLLSRLHATPSENKIASDGLDGDRTVRIWVPLGSRYVNFRSNFACMKAGSSLQEDQETWLSCSSALSSLQDDDIA